MTNSTAPPMELITIETEMLVPCRQNPRQRRSQKDDEDLLASVKQHGLLSPIIARSVGYGPDARFEIAAGHRRWEVATTLGLGHVPVIVREMTDEDFYNLVILDNLQHATLHPLDEAEGYQRLMTSKNLDLEGLAALVNKKPAEVAGSLKLLDLSDTARKAFEAEKIDARGARLLSRLQPADQNYVFKDLNRQTDGPVSTTDIRRFIERELELDLSKASFDVDDTGLYPEAGSCLTCPKRSGANQTLFADVKAKDHCFDRACFRKKSALHLARVEEGLKASDRPYKPISLKYSGSNNLPGTSDYLRIDGKATCPTTITGLVKEVNYGDGTLGETFLICTNRNCTVHRSSERYTAPRPSAAAQQKTRIENVLQKRDRAIREAMLDSVLLDVARHGPQVEDMRLVVKAYFDRFWHDAKREFFKRKGIEPIKAKQHGGKDFEMTFEQNVLVKAATLKELYAVLVDLALHFSVAREGSADLLNACSRHGVDLKTIRSGVTKQYADKLERAKKPIAGKDKKAAPKATTKPDKHPVKKTAKKKARAHV